MTKQQNLNHSDVLPYFLFAPAGALLEDLEEVQLRCTILPLGIVDASIALLSLTRIVHFLLGFVEAAVAQHYSQGEQGSYVVNHGLRSPTRNL